MSITDELRRFIEDPLLGYAPQDQHIEMLTKIADCIDAEHEALRDQLDTSERQKESYREDLLAANRQVHASYNDGYDEGFASADDWLGQHEDAMAEHGWVRLPVDADNVPIHAGDVLDGYGKTIEVVELRHGRSGWVLISREGSGYADTFAFTHHHAPTVEDVLREFGDWYAHTKGGCDEDGIIAEFAAKLRLAGDAE